MISTKFIKATPNYATYAQPVSAPYVRKTFTLDAVPETAQITLTCTGFYRLWVNGTEITGSRLAPCITNPDDIIFYDHYDAAELLTAGENCIALLLGNGISNCMGGFIWEFDQALFRSAPKLALHFEAACGEKTVSFEADDSFKCAPSPIYFDDLRSGEFYDARLEADGWNKPGFDDSGWTSAIPTDPARGKTLMNETDKIVVTKELKPVKIYEGHSLPINLATMREISRTISETAFYRPDEDEKGYVFEFAENTACVPKLKIRGRKGQKIIIQASEYCDENGGISYENIARFYPIGFCQRDIYICKGEGVEEYVPSFTYHGARYFFVIGADKEQISDETVTMLVQNSDLAERGSFSCSDPIANALQRNTRISDLANFVYFPTDCPHREKNGWTGDAGMSAEHMMQNLVVENSWKQWLKMICAAQREDGALPGIIPTSGWGYSWGNGPVWDQVIVELPYVAYIYRGDTELFRLCSDAVVKYLNYIAGRRSPDGTICIGLGDWCDAMRPGGSNHVCPTEVS
ncbi:MAG: family 78 glycoside hydrolase catalytic domain, partial [Eubacteriales bacterium]